ncbi:EAL domain-containing protein [uncultured Bilophila sp.]|uniref:bifunctional diguanylate cyclase/phosphodiesterase n=1 Tax=uncultured Bilophila sp. TaxID=529385 RepID=UPI00280BE73A|nr:EAL domain-containing protein [uncultured Bilophila sp.]
MEQMCTAAFAFLESARPFFQHGKPLQERLPFLVRALCGLLPLDALAVVRMEGGRVCETACWSGAPHLPEALMRRAFAGKGFPLDAPFSEKALAALFPKEAAGQLNALALPIECGDEPLGLLFVDNASRDAGWSERERDFLRLVSAMIGISFAGKPHYEQQSFHISVLNAAMDQVKVGLYITDPHTGVILYMNRHMKDAFKLEHPEGRVCWQVLQSGMDGRCPFCPVDILLADAKPDQVFRWEDRNTLTGRVYDKSDSLMRWTDGSIVHLQQSVDITDALRLHQEANYDELTGLLSRRAGKAALAGVLERLDGEEAFLVVGMFDLDRLKEVNDAYGHAEGDRALRIVAQEMQRSLHAPDVCFRLSGDEFVVVFHNTNRYAVDRLMAGVLERLKTGWGPLGLPCPLEFSFGCFEVAPGSGATVSEVLSKADESMYEQKKRAHIREAERRLREKRGEGEIPPEALRYDSIRLYDALVKSTDSYVFVSNMKTGIFRYSPSMVEEFGLPQSIVRNAAAVWGSKVHPDDRAAFMEANQIIADGRSDFHCVEYRAKNRKGEWIWVRCRGYLERDEDGEPSLFAGFITNLGQKNKIDHVAGLFNKLKFEEDIGSMLEKRPEHPLHMLILGLDAFKHINELYGKSFGDEILRVIGQRIQGMLPLSASVYRLDGDEFGITVSGERLEMMELYRSISESFRSQQQYDGKKYFCTISAGSASYPEDASGYADLSQYASYSLKHAKMLGRNRIVFFSRDLLEQQMRSLELVELLRESIERQFEGFKLVYQPQISAGTRHVVGAEALARWTCAKYGPVSPGEFIPLLEQSGLIIPFGRWVFREAAAQCKAWTKLRPDFEISINLSYLQVVSDSMIPFIRDTLARLGLSPSNLMVEFTESCMIRENVRIRAVFESIRSLGIRIAMDDFGTGYSSLGMLKNSPADVVKIDRTFVRDILTSRFDATFIRFVVALCHDVDIKVCLEGVELEQEFDRVRPMGLDFIQGFLFGKPVPPDVFERDFLMA